VTAVSVAETLKRKVCDGAKAVGVGRYYLFPLAAAGQVGVERALLQIRTEIERGMKLTGCASISELSASNVRFR
jgi:L-lactate dehydrogenase (cytochrome)